MKREEETYFVKVLGSSPIVRVLDFLIVFREFDYSLTEIAKESGVAWSTLNKVFPKLEKYGLVKQTRQIGRAKLYKLNEEKPMVRQLIELHLLISDNFIKKEISKQKIEVLSKS